MKEEQQIEKSPYKWKALKSLKLPNPDNPKVPKTLKLQISNVHVLKIQPTSLKSLIEWLLLGALLHGLSEASNQVKCCNLVCCLVPEK